MPDGKLYLVNDDFLRRVERLERWVASFRLNGDGVYANSSTDGFSATIRQRVEPKQASAAGDFSVYYGGTPVSANTGEYEGFCFRSLLSNPTTGTPCHFINDEEVADPTNPLFGPTHWIHGSFTGIGRFDGEYTSDTPPKPIIHITSAAQAYTRATPVGAYVPFVTTQGWNRHFPYLDASNVANAAAVVGDQAVQIKVPTTNAGKYRDWIFDPSGRIVSISVEH